jgi:hypothetical protein
MRSCEQKKEVDFDNGEMKSEAVVAVADAADEEKKGDELSEVIKDCRFCGRAPCLVHDIYSEMTFVASGMEGEHEDNKEIPHALYSLVAKKLFGRLGKSVVSRFLVALWWRFTTRILRRTR